MAKKKSNTLKLEDLKRWIPNDRDAHKKWWKGNKGYAQKAYDYYETFQEPEHIPDGTKFYAKLNMVKDDHQTAMGILSNSNPEFELSGRSRSTNDRRKVAVQKAAMEWMGEEAGLKKVLLAVLFDYGLAGMGEIDINFNPYHITKLNTLGGIELKRIPPGDLKLDSRGQDPDGLSGQHLFIDRRVTREMFEDFYAVQYFEQTGKHLDIDEIFKSTMSADHWDYMLDNKSRKRVHEQEITVLDFDYRKLVWRDFVDPFSGQMVTDDEGKPIKVPIQEFRKAIIAGNKILSDVFSPLTKAKTFSKIIFPNNRLYSIPYAIGSFLELKPMQDLVNIMLSMMIDNQARGMNDPIAAIAGTIGSGENIIKNIGQHKFLFLNFSEELEAMGLTPKDIMPQRLGFDPQDPGWFQALNWVLQITQKITSKEVLKGSQPAGVRSATALTSLQQAAMQPLYYAKKKLEAPCEILGAAMHELMQTNITDEIELPLSEYNGRPETITINRQMEAEEIVQVLQEASQNDNAEVREMLSMVTVRRGDNRTSLTDFVVEKKAEFFLDPEMLGQAMQAEVIEFVENDITEGEYNCKIVLDTLKDINKQEKMASASVFMQSMQAVQAPFTALEYGMEVAEIPERHELLEKAKAESEIWQLGIQTQQQMQQQAEQQPTEGGEEIEREQTERSEDVSEE